MCILNSEYIMDNWANGSEHALQVSTHIIFILENGSLSKQK